MTGLVPRAGRLRPGRRVLAAGAFTLSAALGAGSCAVAADAQGQSGRARAQHVAQAVARSLGVANAAEIDFVRWRDRVPVGDLLFVYHPARDALSVHGSTGAADLDPAQDTPAFVANVRAALRAENDPALGGMFERGGAYSVVHEREQESALARDYPVATVGSGQVRQGTEYLTSLAATWRLHWGARVASLVHRLDGAEPLAGPVPWEDERRALDADVSRLTGRERARAVVRAYLAHRLVPGATLGDDTPRARALGAVPDAYDGGDFYLRYLPEADQLEAGVFVATPADLARLRQAGLPGDQFAAVLAAGRPGDRARPDALAPAFTAPAPYPGGAAPAATTFVHRAPPARPDGPALLYLVQRYPVAALTPRALHLALEPLLDYGTVWRHRWLWRAARMRLGREPVPARPLVRTPDDYGVDAASERLDAPPSPVSPPAPGPASGAPGRPLGGVL